MTLPISATLASHSRPVILLEGTRQLPAENRPELVRLAEILCDELPHAVFRSGNAEGADEVFANAVAGVDPSRLELVVPTAGMGRGRRPAGSRCVSLETLSPAELEHVVVATRQAGRDAGRLADYYLNHGPQTRSAAVSKAAFLLRDSLKVIGAPTLGLRPATIGFFFVNPVAPAGGGTGHTIRVCELNGVRAIVQSEWLSWLHSDAKA